MLLKLSLGIWSQGTMCLSSRVWLQCSVQRSQLHPSLGKALSTLASGLALLKDRVGLSLLGPFQCQCVVCGSTKEADGLCTGELSVTPGPCTGWRHVLRKRWLPCPVPLCISSFYTTIQKQQEIGQFRILSSPVEYTWRVLVLDLIHSPIWKLYQGDWEGRLESCL